jgi:hypothetical protein
VIIYLIIRSFIRYGEGEVPSTHSHGPDKNSKVVSKKVSKGIGEYVDYEEVDK